MDGIEAKLESPLTDDERKKIFAEKLRRMLLDRGWSPADLSREAHMNRDNTSRYLRGKSLPDNKRLQQLAKALRCDPDDLVPGMFLRSVALAASTEDFRVVPSTTPGLVRLTVDKLVSAATAARVMELLADEPFVRVADRS